MQDLLESAKGLLDFILNYIDHFIQFFKSVGEAALWFSASIEFLPVYMKVALSTLVALTLIMLILDRG